MWVDGGSLQVTQLAFGLLEYRRAHNIFEVGDKVVFKHIGDHLSTFGFDRSLVYKISSTKWIMQHEGTVRLGDVVVNVDYIRHATNKEIYIGRRL